MTTPTPAPNDVPQRTAETEALGVAGALTSMRIDELISNLAIGIAQGQMQLDQAHSER